MLHHILRLLATWLVALGALPALSLTTDSGDSHLWQLYLAYRDAGQTAAAGSRLYATYNGNLLVYDTDDQSQTTIDRQNGLSSKGISRITWSEAAGCLMALYEDNNIDLIYTDGTVFNMPQLKNYSEVAITPTRLRTMGQWAVLSTTNGVVLFDLTKREVSGYYQLGLHALDGAVVGDSLCLALADHAFIKGRLTDNLYSLSEWHTNAQGLNASVVMPHGTGAYLSVNFDENNAQNGRAAYRGLCYMDAQGRINHVHDQFPTNGLELPGGGMAFHDGGWLLTTSADQPTQKQYVVRLPTSSLEQLARTTDDTWWLTSNDTITAWHIDLAQGTVTAADPVLGGFGPRRDDCYNLSYTPYGRLLVAGGRLDYAGGQSIDTPTAMALDDDGEWHFFQEKGFTLNDGARYQSVLSIAEDPADPTHHFVGSRSGLLEFRDFQFVKHYNASNSPLQIAYGAGTDPSYTITDGLLYDGSGNLIMTNYATRNTLKMLTADNQWLELYDPAFTTQSTPEKTLLDADGRLWVTSRNTTSITHSGLYCIDYGGTFADTSDDQSAYRTQAVNEDGTSCDLQGLYDIKADRKGQLWIGCASGVYAVTDPATWLGGSFSLYQPKVPRNDGTNYADYLLTGIPVSAIAVDQGNRKWLGTLGSGLYLVNEDGSEVLAHYTSADSPLLSDNVWSLALHPTTGLLMIATDKGLCSYRTGVTPPQSSLTASAIHVYPNPVRPTYQGNVTITGLTEGAEVKIVSSAGQLIKRLTAIGGSAQWDVKGPNGAGRVAPGVYYILAADAQSTQAAAAKIVVI